MPESVIIQWLACAVGAILLIGSVSAVITKWVQPYREMKRRIHELEIRRESYEEVSKDICESTHLLCKALLILLDHEITGNSVDKLKDIRAEIREYLINK